LLVREANILHLVLKLRILLFSCHSEALLGKNVNCEARLQDGRAREAAPEYPLNMGIYRSLQVTAIVKNASFSLGGGRQVLGCTIIIV